ncbi:MAG: 30S ribosomal protein S8e [Candidatus Thermoplasmatota archaeon]|jgi:small subunit ribosomal protein S8e|nr:30S ribosomal protein S8e [Candidatus Thermoplasmatota archaeon]MCL6089871.1 30S ribosomal protein S8e [Candidatus Thermoplasmatota archaeon]MDA8143799.1 30S ribosomal protein S8e [Thermoplasmatales archaeon]
MTIFQGKSRKKFTGGKLKASRTKKRFELGREPTLTRIGPEARKVMRIMGGTKKAVLMRAESANVYVPGEKITKKVKIQTVKENPANPHHVQRNIMSKGTVILTELGEARITSRPGQDGIVNAVLL